MEGRNSGGRGNDLKKKKICLQAWQKEEIEKYKLKDLQKIVHTSI